MKNIDSAVSGAIAIGGFVTEPPIGILLWGTGLAKDAYNTSASDLPKDALINATGYPGLPKSITNLNAIYTIYDVYNKAKEANSKYQQDVASIKKGTVQ